jgi:PHD/YefM family antitoxin component YafN of YafNO toxin-antitoxin module
MIKYAYYINEVILVPKILPSSDLRNKYNELSVFCNTYNEPVFITKNGAGDLVILSNNAYEELTGRRELHRLIDEGLLAMKAGGGRQAGEVFAGIEKEYGLNGL